MEEVKHTPGPFRTHQGDEDGPDRWCVVVDGPKPWLVATIENGAPGDTLETEGANARLFAAAPDLFALAKAYERWEADVLLSEEAWQGNTAPLPTLTQPLWDRLIELQTMRNAAVRKAAGGK